MYILDSHWSQGVKIESICMASEEVKHGAKMQNGVKEFVKSNLIFYSDYGTIS